MENFSIFKPNRRRRTYHSWANMIQRCTNPANPDFADYGGSGITVAKRWLNFSAGHLKRNAYLYVRQSTLRQVLENTESTLRQYDLRQRAVTLGWPVERIMVIDSDLGQSAATAANREGFQKLVTEVST